MPRSTLIAASVILVLVAAPAEHAGPSSTSTASRAQVAAGRVAAAMADVEALRTAEPVQRGVHGVATPLAIGILPASEVVPASDDAPLPTVIEATSLRAVAGDLSSAAVAVTRLPLSSRAATSPIATPALTPAPALAAPRSAREVVALEGYGTYIHELLREGAFLTRWSTHDRQALRVWIADLPADTEDPDRRERFRAVVRDAFDSWAESGLPLRFEFVNDASAADVRVHWTDRFPQPINGKTRWSHDADGWILDGEITLALRQPSGSPLDESSLRAISLHEVGHLLGLDHVSDARSIMAPLVRARELSGADRATARLLYRLPAGELD